MLYGEIANMKDEYNDKEIVLNIIDRCNVEEIETIKDVIISLYPHLNEVVEKKKRKIAKPKGK